MLKNYQAGGKSYLADDCEESFLWELEASRQSVVRMEAKGGRPNRVLIDTRGKAVFLETFVESASAAADDSIRIKPEFQAHAGQLLADAQHLYPMAHMPIIGAR